MLEPTVVYNSRDGWTAIRGRDKKDRLRARDGSNILDSWFKFTGTVPLTNVGTNSLAVATITGVPVAVRPGDVVTVNPKAALAAAVALTTVRVPTNGTIVVTLACPDIATAGSQAAVGVDVGVLRIL